MVAGTRVALVVLRTAGRDEGDDAGKAESGANGAGTSTNTGALVSILLLSASGARAFP